MKGACSGVTEDWSGVQGGQVVRPLVVVVAGVKRTPEGRLRGGNEQTVYTFVHGCFYWKQDQNL